jgi:hypothetical protein
VTDDTVEPPPELAAPRPLPRRRGRELMSGINLVPERKLQALDDEDLERVVEWWVHERTADRYAHVVGHGGTGDKGRDVAGYTVAVGRDPWDNYQCKQYGSRLGPAEVAAEAAKLVFYVNRGDYSCPRKYYFAAPKGISSQATDLISNHDQLRTRLSDRWDKDYGNLCSSADIDGALAEFEFPEFVPVDPSTIIADLRRSSSYPYFFGGGFTKPRPTNKTPPDAIGPEELRYVNELIAAYAEHHGNRLASVESALTHAEYGPDLKGSRQDFYCAESLREFSRDVFPDVDVFAELQQLVHQGIRFTLARGFPNGFDRSLAVREHSTTIELGDHPLAGEVDPADRSGICHQLVNEGAFRWVK